MPTIYDDWAVQYRCETATKDPDLLLGVTRAAQALLWAMTGRRFGIARTTGEFYRAAGGERCGCGPYKTDDGHWRNGCRSDCCSILLAYQPVRQVDEVRLYGVAMPVGSYDLTGATLRRIGSCWPMLDVCDAPVIEVDYTWGADVPIIGELALGEVACDMLGAYNGGECRLPSRVTSITRQGVTVELADPSLFIEKGLLGMPFADAFIRSVNPHGLQQRARVFSVDVGGRVG